MINYRYLYVLPHGEDVLIEADSIEEAIEELENRYPDGEPVTRDDFECVMFAEDDDDAVDEYEEVAIDDSDDKLKEQAQERHDALLSGCNMYIPVSAIFDALQAKRDDLRETK